MYRDQNVEQEKLVEKLREKILRQRKDEIHKVKTEREKFKDLETKKPPIRYMTVNLSQCSLNNVYDQKEVDYQDYGIGQPDNISANVSRMSTQNRTSITKVPRDSRRSTSLKSSYDKRGSNSHRTSRVENIVVSKVTLLQKSGGNDIVESIDSIRSSQLLHDRSRQNSLRAINNGLNMMIEEKSVNAPAASAVHPNEWQDQATDLKLREQGLGIEQRDQDKIHERFKSPKVSFVPLDESKNDEIIARSSYVEKTPYQKMVLLNDCFQQMSKCKDYISLYSQSRKLLRQ